MSTLTTEGHRQVPVRVDTHLRAGEATGDSWCSQELTLTYLDCEWYRDLGSPKEGSRDGEEEAGSTAERGCGVAVY